MCTPTGTDTVPLRCQVQHTRAHILAGRDELVHTRENNTAREQKHLFMDSQPFSKKAKEWRSRSSSSSRDLNTGASDPFEIWQLTSLTALILFISLS